MATTTLPPKYVNRDGRTRRDGAHTADKVCTRCGKALGVEVNVALELDQRVGEYHDFGGVPEAQSQGWFLFGPDCATALRVRARAALARAGIVHERGGAR